LFEDALSPGSRSAAWWRERVRALSPELDAERWGDLLVLRARERSAWPLLEWIRASKPEKLEVSCGRPALAFERALASLGARAQRFANATARAGFTRGHLLEVVVNLPGGVGSDEELADAETLIWTLLGERRAEAWIGSVKVAPAPRGGALRVVPASPDAGFPLAQLADAVNAAITGLYAGLSDEPHFAREDSKEWTLFELTPESAPDWADEDDLVMASTCVPELLKSRLSKQPFSSERFSRHGELFFHLKFESRGSAERRLKSRSKLEDALDGGLVAKRLGRVVGAGLGLRYSYVLLALVNPEQAVRECAEIARRHEVGKAAWLLPLDTDLSREWCGVWPDSAAPYGLRAEGEPIE
jgi:hypothetical protein